MINPCKKCIVSMMCEKKCDTLVEYLVKSLNYGDENKRIVLVFKLAERLRKGEIALYNGDKDWRII